MRQQMCRALRGRGGACRRTRAPRRGRVGSPASRRGSKTRAAGGRVPVIRSWARTDVGKKRKHNEDAFLADDALGLYVVADGMGGHAAGEVASAQAVQSIRAALAPSRPILDRFAAQPSVEARESIGSLMETAIQKACADVYYLSQADADRGGMGPTGVAILVAGKNRVIGHV